jgi:fatty-acyl-CoA synthase
VRERTPERAAVPVALHVVDPMPLTGVGKVFKPALRWDAARRVVTRMLADVAPAGGNVSVEVGAHPVHGSLISVTIDGVPKAAHDALAAQVHAHLDPLVMRHEVVWR